MVAKQEVINQGTPVYVSVSMCECACVKLKFKITVSVLNILFKY